MQAAAENWQLYCPGTTHDEAPYGALAKAKSGLFIFLGPMAALSAVLKDLRFRQGEQVLTLVEAAAEGYLRLVDWRAGIPPLPELTAHWHRWQLERESGCDLPTLCLLRDPEGADCPGADLFVASQVTLAETVGAKMETDRELGASMAVSEASIAEPEAQTACWQGPYCPQQFLRDKEVLGRLGLARPRFYQALDLWAQAQGKLTPVPDLRNSVDSFAALLDLELATALDQKGRALRRGYTTGSTATAAAKAAALVLSGAESALRRDEDGRVFVEIELPALDGEAPRLAIPLNRIERPAPDQVRVVVNKDAGDDPDVTDGLEIWADVTWQTGEGLDLQGGTGIGTVTLPGLAVPVGEKAINPVPRKMLADNLAPIMARSGRGLRVMLTVPEGERIAQKTYNPRLGIVGGLSIIGTTGIVEPLSEEALRESMARELNLCQAVDGETAYFCLGNMGEKLLRSLYGERLAGLPLLPQIGNEIGFMFGRAVALGFERVVLCGALGKLIKVAAGIFYTHSHVADARAETALALAILAGFPVARAEELYAQVTTDAVLPLLREEGVLEPFLALVAETIWQRVHLEFPEIRGLDLILSNGRGEFLYRLEREV